MSAIPSAASNAASTAITATPAAATSVEGTTAAVAEKAEQVFQARVQDAPRPQGVAISFITRESVSSGQGPETIYVVGFTNEELHRYGMTNSNSPPPSN